MLAALLLPLFADVTPMAQTSTTAPAPPADEAPIVAKTRGLDLYLTSGLLYFGSDRRVIAGAGGGGGVRYVLTPHWTVGVEGRYVTYVGNAFSVSGGVDYRLPFGAWVPSAGLRVLMVGGQYVEVIEPGSSGRVASLGWAIQAQLAFGRFVHGPFSASFLQVDAGLGQDGRSLAKAFTITLLELGVRIP